jgi:hypothetical protein
MPPRSSYLNAYPDFQPRPEDDLSNTFAALAVRENWKKGSKKWQEERTSYYYSEFTNRYSNDDATNLDTWRRFCGDLGVQEPRSITHAKQVGAATVVDFCATIVRLIVGLFVGGYSMLCHGPVVDRRSWLKRETGKEKEADTVLTKPQILSRTYVSIVVFCNALNAGTPVYKCHTYHEFRSYMRKKAQRRMPLNQAKENVFWKALLKKL